LSINLPGNSNLKARATVSDPSYAIHNNFCPGLTKTGSRLQALVACYNLLILLIR
ncbi:hypothetical protein THAOC_30254, partial [Thalassiosira oceanica]